MNLQIPTPEEYRRGYESFRANVSLNKVIDTHGGWPIN